MLGGLALQYLPQTPEARCAATASPHHHHHGSSSSSSLQLLQSSASGDSVHALCPRSGYRATTALFAALALLLWLHAVMPKTLRAAAATRRKSSSRAGRPSKPARGQAEGKEEGKEEEEGEEEQTVVASSA